MSHITHVFAGAKHTPVHTRVLLPARLPIGAHLYDPHTRRWGKLVKTSGLKKVIDLPLSRVPYVYQVQALLVST